MLSPTQIADQYAWLYQTALAPADAKWDYLLPLDGCYAAIKQIDGTAYVMFRGSVTFMDWMQDFKDFALPINDPLLGPVHPGFRQGALQALNPLNSAIGNVPVHVVGHSLGAAHAVLFSAYRRVKQLLVEGLTLFGEPKAGGPRVSELLSDVPLISFRNANSDGWDLVTDVPFSDPPQLPYQHARALTDCRGDPRPLDPWLVFRYHHFGLYCKALGCGAPQALSLE